MLLINISVYTIVFIITIIKRYVVRDQLIESEVEILSISASRWKISPLIAMKGSPRMKKYIF